MAKPKKKSYEEDYDEEEEEEEVEPEDEDDDEDNVDPEETKKPLVPDRRPTAKEKRHPKAAKPKTEDRYQPYHSPERAGILDRQTEKPVLEDDLTFKAWVMNKIQKIEDAVC